MFVNQVTGSVVGGFGPSLGATTVSDGNSSRTTLSLCPSFGLGVGISNTDTVLSGVDPTNERAMTFSSLVNMNLGLGLASFDFDFFQDPSIGPAGVVISAGVAGGPTLIKGVNFGVTATPHNEELCKTLLQLENTYSQWRVGVLP